MTARLARYASLLLAVFVLAVWLPQLHNMLFEYRFGKTHLFYSPVIKKFIYKELVGEGHQFIYRDQDEKDYSREEFEALIPFIYYKNMEIWGKLPLLLDGQSFDKTEIKAARQVVELKPTDLGDHSPRIQLFPLLESNPGRARLSFPENVFRPDDKLSFINSDFNRFDEELTNRFGNALKNSGFVYPVKAVFGRVSILKAFDAGYFLTDAKGQFFHLMKVDGEPKISQVALPDGSKVRQLVVAESKRREILGILLDEAGKAYLMGYGDYHILPLILPDYDPDTMELKIIFNPLYRTAVYSDKEVIHAVVMDKSYKVISHHARTMAMARPRLSETIWHVATPFSLQLAKGNSRYLSFIPQFHGWLAIIGNLLSFGIAVFFLKQKGTRISSSIFDLLLVGLTGLYGLIAVVLLPPGVVDGD
ncbi:DUF4857 domain-containing protein [Cohaesibacter celericrescens]|uniref:DUF4857 domain-containing protein n=1 Tax=Cohaesibacter celericrescens TaxID=2067669 RepID=A0A2N5XQ08_9HYPH|nr:DUF4857 domain-containing protein [Cohaesibacter celericrescens]PLW76611.1 DUF4857 domain-containing protein [Cohaesibacter celericrescens]